MKIPVFLTALVLTGIFTWPGCGDGGADLCERARQTIEDCHEETDDFSASQVNCEDTSCSACNEEFDAYTRCIIETDVCSDIEETCDEFVVLWFNCAGEKCQDG